MSLTPGAMKRSVSWVAFIQKLFGILSRHLFSVSTTFKACFSWKQYFWTDSTKLSHWITLSRFRILSNDIDVLFEGLEDFEGKAKKGDKRSCVEKDGSEEWSETLPHCRKFIVRFIKIYFGIEATFCMRGWGEGSEARSYYKDLTKASREVRTLRGETS